MPHYNVGPRFKSITLAVSIICLALAQTARAHGQTGCEYVQTGLGAGDFMLDCTSHLPPGKMPELIPDRYLAIALSPNFSAGVSSGPSKPEVEQRAIAQCKKNGGDACRVVRVSLNMCAAIAISSPHKIIAIEDMPGQGWNPSEMARRKCEASGGHACATIVAGCANGYMSPTPWTPPDGSYTVPTFRRK